VQLRWNTSLRAITAALTLTVSSGGAASAEPGGGQLGPELARLRGEVESLATAIEHAKDDRRVRMRSLSDQVSQAEVELRREQLRKDELEKRVADLTAKVAERDASQAGLAPAVKAALASMRGFVATTLPFRLPERLAAFDALQKKLDDGLLGAAQGWARLWELVETELRLVRDSALDRQVVRLPDGEERLVPVIRLGMAALFYKAGPESFGAVVREGAGWVARPLTTPDQTVQLAALFDSFEKRVRSGFFELPLAALPAAGGGGK
jgi:hypothetical protein